MKSCDTYLTKKNKNSPASQTVAIARIAPKICQGQPPNNVLTVLQISSKSVHFRWSYSRTHKHRQIAPLSESNIRRKLPPSLQSNNKMLTDTHSDS